MTKIVNLSGNELGGRKGKMENEEIRKQMGG
jgi:hypothetical protein